MSVLCATFHRNGEPVPPGAIEGMLAVCLERPVDGQDTWHSGLAALGHGHFLITPEETGERQPLVHQPGPVVVVFDGRLDGRDDLLTALGIDAKAGKDLSDAALLLQAYLRWEKDCARRLDGSFAFIIWDAPQRQLYLARDALGTRSLIYYCDEQRCLVASEISPVLAGLEERPSINERKIAAFLINWFHEHEETYYQKILYCPPGHTVVIGEKNIEISKYWHIDTEIRIRYNNDADYREHYIELLERATRSRMRCTGTTGISLSGGLDSTLLASIAAPLHEEVNSGQGKLQSFSNIFDRYPRCDERPFIALVVERYGLQPHFILADELWTFRDYERWPEDPEIIFADPYFWLPDAVMQAGKQANIRVLLTGHYGDTLLVSDQYWAAELWHEGRLGEFTRQALRHPKEVGRRYYLYDYGLRQLAPGSLRHLYRRIRPVEAGNRLPGIDPDLIQRTGIQDQIRDQDAASRRKFAKPWQWDRYHTLTLNVFAQGSAAVRKYYTRNHMVLETPYWDRSLVEFLMAIPSDQLGRPWRDRWIQRNAARTRLPEVIAERRTPTTFIPLMKKGLFEAETRVLQQLFERPIVVERRMIDRQWLKKIQIQAPDNLTSLDHFWRVICVERWLMKYS